MKKSVAITLGIVGILVIILTIVLHFPRYTYFSSNVEDFPEIVDRAPLKMLGNDADGKYVLVRVSDYGERVQYIMDYNLLKENKESFILTNVKSCYATTCDSWFVLYKDGEMIDQEIFDSDPYYTIKIVYGSLESSFVSIDKNSLYNLLEK